ncbi:hypothetical protein BD414DRAFT_489454 [Trametes punicea]|nr:hypothetical protein BD414DRAFT_489454 [Trametes punicea]
MILAPASPPPSECQSQTALKDTTSHNVPSIAPASTTTRATQSKGYDTREGESAFLTSLKVPTVVLDASSISHSMAAALSLSLLGHTLFLKSQVPFPVAQLFRMPGGRFNPKAAKKREELLATFDTLSSHLQTTFVALSTAYAQRKTTKSTANNLHKDENTPTHMQEGSNNGSQRGIAHLMFVLGPSREDLIPAPATDESEDDDASIDIECTDEEDETDTEDAFEEGDSDNSELSEMESATDDSSEATSDQEDELDELESDGEARSAPTASRSPSPDTPSRSFAPSPESLPSPQTSLGPLPTQKAVAPSSPHPVTAQLSTSTTLPLQPRSPSTSHRSPPQPSDPVPSTLSYAEEQAALRAAERLLSRTLMTAWADGGGDMASELAPMQTHVYLRAPRRFAHPAWVARQNITRTLDGILDAFLVDGGAIRSTDAKPCGRKGREVRTEGVWIGCRGGSAFAAERAHMKSEDECKTVDGAEDGDEGDEDIWWAWESKIVGFVDW